MVDLLPRTRLQPDTRHRFRVETRPATHVRLDIYPDGGIARLRLFGSLTADGLRVITPALFTRTCAEPEAKLSATWADYG